MTPLPSPVFQKAHAIAHGQRIDTPHLLHPLHPAGTREEGSAVVTSNCLRRRLDGVQTTRRPSSVSTP